MAKGVLAGTVGLLAAPAIGAHQEGFVGFAKGAAAGIASAVLLPVVGVGIGTAQVVRGLVNTPEALRESARGKHWDEVGARMGGFVGVAGRQAGGWVGGWVGGMHGWLGGG